MKFVYEYDTRPEGPSFSGPIKHIVHPTEADSTLCEEFIDTQFSYEVAEPSYEGAEPCLVCNSMARTRVLDDARSFVARELGVDESEVF